MDATEIELRSAMDVENATPKCLIVWADQHDEMTPDETRKLGRRCFEVAESADSDLAVYRWLKSNGVDDVAATNLIEGLRGFRVETL